MPDSVQLVAGPAPAGSLLEAYQQPEHYTDAYSARVDGDVSFEDYVTAFFCSPRFRPERWLLGLWPSMRAGDAHARALAAGHRNTFSAWLVEARRASEMLLVDKSGRTRSWLMASPSTSPRGQRQTVLYFGSAVCDVAERPPRWFRMLRGFHIGYSKKLLRSAVRTLPKVMPSDNRAS